jgi:hypothetical protein
MIFMPWVPRQKEGRGPAALVPVALESQTPKHDRTAPIVGVVSKCLVSSKNF